MRPNYVTPPFRAAQKANAEGEIFALPVQKSALQSPSCCVVLDLVDTLDIMPVFGFLFYFVETLFQNFFIPFEMWPWNVRRQNVIAEPEVPDYVSV